MTAQVVRLRERPTGAECREGMRNAEFWRAAGLSPWIVGQAIGIRCASWPDVATTVSMILQRERLERAAEARAERQYYRRR